jgi:hypothetical protein
LYSHLNTGFKPKRSINDTNVVVDGLQSEKLYDFVYQLYALLRTLQTQAIESFNLAATAPFSS